jgi:hypothetical protein
VDRRLDWRDLPAALARAHWCDRQVHNWSDGRWVREVAAELARADDEPLPEEWPDLAPLLELFDL